VPFGGRDDLAAARHVSHNRNKIPHSARGDKETRLFAEQGRRPFLEGDYGRIILEDVVADLSYRHRAAHLGGGVGHRVGAQIDAASPAAS
jgi:hypothetical protein